MGESGKGSGKFIIVLVEESKDVVSHWTDGVGCNAVLEVSDADHQCQWSDVYWDDAGGG